MPEVLSNDNQTMTTETKTIEVPAYRDDNGNPCCAANFQTGEVCPFFRTQCFGTHETCVFAESADGKRTRGINRRGDGAGTLIPLDTCPVWNKKP